MNSKRYLFLGCLYPENLHEEVVSKSKDTMRDAANVLQWHIIEGLEHHLRRSIDIYNLLPINSYPKHYKDYYIKTTKFSHSVGASDVNIGFCNLQYFKQLLKTPSAYMQINKWHNNDYQNIIFLYTLDKHYLYSIKKLKQKDPSIVVIAIVADLPEFSNLSSNQGWFKRLYNKFNSRRISKRLKLIDGFVLLTQQMSDVLGIKAPYTVMEGIATLDRNLENLVRNNPKMKQILYSGTLHEKFGVLNLVKAFSKISDTSYRLVICGVGDSKDKLVEYAKRDERIIFMGQVPRNEVLKLQRESTVLINPRQNIDEFTKYSFPSKNLEYLSSGVPLIAYKLEGIPDEYDDYIYYVKDNSIDSLATKIIEVCEKDPGELNEFSQNAKNFVASEKSAIKQTSKIMELLKIIEEKG